MDSRTGERVSHLNTMIRVLGGEISDARALLAPTQSRRDLSVQETRSVELLVSSLEGQLQCVQSLAAAEEGNYAPVLTKFGGVGKDDADIIEAKRNILEMMKADHESKLSNAKRDAERKMEELQSLESSITLKQRQLQALNEELSRLQSGSRPSRIQPWPMTYAKPSGSKLDKTYLLITPCSLCANEFLDYDVVVASCQHLYHPWCSVVVFSKWNNCVEPKCHGVANRNRQLSFGWGFVPEEMGQQQGQPLGTREVPPRIEGAPSNPNGKAPLLAGTFITRS